MRLVTGDNQSTEDARISNNNKRYGKIVIEKDKTRLRIETLMSEESGSATKRFDFLKVLNSQNYQIVYGNGLSCRNTGRSPLSRNFIMSLDGDTNEEVLDTI